MRSSISTRDKMQKVLYSDIFWEISGVVSVDSMYGTHIMVSRDKTTSQIRLASKQSNVLDELKDKK